MVRRGWQELEGRPKAEKWPAATRKGQETQSNGGRWRRSSQQGGIPKPSGNRRLNPDEALDVARARESRGGVRGIVVGDLHVAHLQEVSFPGRRTLGKLGGLHPHGQRTAPCHCGDDDHERGWRTALRIASKWSVSANSF